jgi:hypothetical protein
MQFSICICQYNNCAWFAPQCISNRKLSRHTPVNNQESPINSPVLVLFRKRIPSHYLVPLVLSQVIHLVPCPLDPKLSSPQLQGTQKLVQDFLFQKSYLELLHISFLVLSLITPLLVLIGSVLKVSARETELVSLKFVTLVCR